MVKWVLFNFLISPLILMVHSHRTKTWNRTRSIVPYCASPIPCSCPVHIHVECEGAINLTPLIMGSAVLSTRKWSFGILLESDSCSDRKGFWTMWTDGNVEESFILFCASEKQRTQETADCDEIPWGRNYHKVLCRFVNVTCSYITKVHCINC